MQELENILENLGKNTKIPDMTSDAERGALIAYKERLRRQHIKRLLNIMNTAFDYEGVPEEWDLNLRKLENYFQVMGFAGVSDENTDGKVREYQGGLGGECDAHYEPQILTVANPWDGTNKSLDQRKGEVVIGYNDSLRTGILPIIELYADLLTENTISIKQASIQSRAIALISAEDDATLEAVNKYLDDLVLGKLTAAGENQFFEGIRVQPLQNGANQTIKNLIELHQYLKASELQELGINANFNMKREALNSAESALNTDALIPLLDDMLHCRQEFVDKLNKRYGTNITVKLHGIFDHYKDENGDGIVEPIEEETTPEGAENEPQDIIEEVIE